MEASEEIELISNMLLYAAKYHLEPEVVTSFYWVIKRKPDMDLLEAVNIALGEWDID